LYKIIKNREEKIAFSNSSESSNDLYNRKLKVSFYFKKIEFSQINAFFIYISYHWFYFNKYNNIPLYIGYYIVFYSDSKLFFFFTLTGSTKISSLKTSFFSLFYYITPISFYCFLMKIVIDLDGTLCSLRKSGQDYSQVTPNDGAVEYVKSLKEKGHYIIIQTARHMETCGSNV
jgi:hypothetical protein